MSERKYRHPQVNLRLPEELKAHIAELAEKNGRSANSEMVKAIEFWVSANREMADNPDKYPISPEKVEIRKDQIPEIVNEVRKQLMEHLFSHYDISPKSKKPT